MAIKLTLDTNSIVYLFDNSTERAGSYEDLAALIRYGLSGKAEISITTRVEADLLRDKEEGRRAQMLRRLEVLPVVGTVLRWDVSKWGSGDMWGSDESQRLHDEVQQILFPGLTTEDKRYSNKINDIDHLVGHKLNGRDIFVTDDKGIWRRRDALRTGPGIVVMKPRECVRYIDDVEQRQTPSTLAAATANSSYRSTALEAQVTFDYSNNDGRFVIGEGHFLFETKWSKASNTSIHAYNDSPSIRGIGLARGVQEINEIRDATAFDYSSRTRTPQRGQIVVWQNENGLYAATKILAINDDSRGDDRDELTFEYVILSSGKSDFCL